MATGAHNRLAKLGEAMETERDSARRARLELELAELLASLGSMEDATRALALCEEAHEALRRTGDAGALIEADRVAGVVRAARGELGPARMELERAFAAARRHDEPRLFARVAANLGEVMAALGDAAGARDVLELARSGLDPAQDGARLAGCLGALATLEVEAGRGERALELARRSLEAAEASGDALARGQTLVGRAAIHRRLGDGTAAVRCYRQAIEIFLAAELARQAADACALCGELIGAAGGRLTEGAGEPAGYWLVRALDLYRQAGTAGGIERVRQALRRYGRRAEDRAAGGPPGGAGAEAGPGPGIGRGPRAGAQHTFADLAAASGVMRKRIQLAQAAARTEGPVLIAGEPGTGKEILAEALHNASARAAGPYCVLRAAALPPSAIEIALFGSAGGPGLLEAAGEGTLVIDEVAALPLGAQLRLARALGSQAFERVGGTERMALAARVIAITSRSLTEETARGRFRPELLARLAAKGAEKLEMPALRERAQDIPLLAEQMLSRLGAQLERRARGVTAEAMEALLSQAWPGNLRELEALLERALLETPVDATVIERLPEAAGSRRGGRARPAGQGEAGTVTQVASLEAVERDLLLAALEEHRGSVPRVARSLGVSRGTVYNKMKKFGIDPAEFRKSELAG